jgi:alkenylglycerophosphocholine/alkenylglycerophosphoethanolamine hydrolase
MTAIYVVVAGYLVCAVLAIVGSELEIRPLVAVFKPLTTLLLFLMVGNPDSRFQAIVEMGFFFSLLGDVALLWKGQGAFMAGLSVFLLAHVSYIVAFVGMGAWSPRIPLVALAFLATSFTLVKIVWPGAGALRIPVVIYAVAITTMVVAASSTLGGRLACAAPAVIGAVLFYVSDSSLALDKFRRKRIPHAAFLTMGLYWLGQLGIALAARAGPR